MCHISKTMSEIMFSQMAQSTSKFCDKFESFNVIKVVNGIYYLFYSLQGNWSVEAIFIILNY